MNRSKDKNKKIITYLNSPLGYKYKCAIVYDYNPITNIKFNGTFYIGNPKTSVNEACVTISVVFPDNMSSVFADPSVASLLFVTYYESCSENKGLPHGEGTADMIYTSMSFVKQMCPFVKEFKLNDTSKRKCDNGSTISLPFLYLSQYEMTWYESRFKAYLKEPDYTRYKNIIEQSMTETLPSFNTFSQFFIKNTSNSIKNALHGVYSESKNMREFFKTLYEKYGKNMGCILLQPWIENYITSIGLNKYITLFDWYISVDTIPTYKLR
jgi:hypothetical protein